MLETIAPLKYKYFLSSSDNIRIGRRNFPASLSRILGVRKRRCAKLVQMEGETKVRLMEGETKKVRLKVRLAETKGGISARPSNDLVKN